MNILHESSSRKTRKNVTAVANGVVYVLGLLNAKAISVTLASIDITGIALVRDDSLAPRKISLGGVARSVPRASYVVFTVVTTVAGVAKAVALTETITVFYVVRARPNGNMVGFT